MRRVAAVGAGLLALAGVAQAWAGPVTFRIDSLTSAGAVVREHNTVTGDDRGGIALSSTQVFYTGDSFTGGFDRNTLATSMQSQRMDGIVGLIGNKQLYALSTDATTPGSIFGGTGGAPLTHLIALDPSGIPTGSSVPLSTAIAVSDFQNGVFAGWDSIFVFLGGTVVEIDPLTGVVMPRGSVALSSAQFAESWALRGVAEHFGGEDYLTYATFSGIRRTRLSNGQHETVAFGAGGLADMAAFTVDPFAGRWYFHHEGTSLFRAGDETIGYANATFTVVPAGVAEPGTAALLVMALGALALGRRKRRAR
jgi:hypothetical protein